MDTRTKILTVKQVVSLPLDRPVIVTGYFDLLGAEHARELHAIRARTAAQSLVAIVMPWARAFQSQQARAEMAAALRVIDYAVPIETEIGLAALLAALHPVEVVRLEALHACRNRELIDHVHRRNPS